MSWIQHFTSIFQANSDTQNIKGEGEDFNCCVRNTTKPKPAEQVLSPRQAAQPATPWIREGYACSGRSSTLGYSTVNFVPEIGRSHQEDIALLKAEICAVGRAIDEGERRIKILESSSSPGTSPISKNLVKDLQNLRIKAADLSAKLRELEELTSPRPK